MALLRQHATLSPSMRLKPNGERKIQVSLRLTQAVRAAYKEMAAVEFGGQLDESDLMRMALAEWIQGRYHPKKDPL
jgi:hypothetical protein